MKSHNFIKQANHPNKQTNQFLLLNLSRHKFEKKLMLKQNAVKNYYESIATSFMYFYIWNEKTKTWINFEFHNKNTKMLVFHSWDCKCNINFLKLEHKRSSLHYPVVVNIYRRVLIDERKKRWKLSILIIFPQNVISLKKFLFYLSVTIFSFSFFMNYFCRNLHNNNINMNK